MAEKLTEKKVERLKYDPEGSRLQRTWDSVEPGLGIELFSSGRKSWIYRYRISGRQRILTLGASPSLSLDEARSAAREAASQLRAGRDPKAVKVQQRNADTLTDLVERYIETPYFRSRSSDFQNNFPSALRRHLLPYLGDQRPDAVTREQVVQIIDRLIEDDKEGAARGLLTHTRILFRYAVDQGLLQHSPVDNIRPRYTSDGKRHEWLRTADQLRSVWFLDVPQQARLLIRWSLLTGCRRDEARLTRWSDLDTVWISRDTKNSADLVLPVMPMMRDILAEMRATYPQSEWLFPATTDTSKPIPRGTLDYIVRTATDGDWSMHVLRHTVESHLHELGVPEEQRDLVLNHVRASSGYRYNHSTGLKMKREALERWHKFLAASVGDRNAGPRYRTPEFEQADARLMGMDGTLSEVAELLTKGGATESATALREVARQIGRLSLNLAQGGVGDWPEEDG